jgi:IS4 transposase
MTKMGKAKYTCNAKALTTNEIMEGLKRKKKTKRSKLLNVWYASEVVEYKGLSVKLFFCKTTRKGKWSVLLSTNTKLEFEEAYRIYATRWAIEVFFKESKQYFGLGKSQSQDFDAQIADSTISMLQFNTLSLVKRFTDYETMGELFRQTKAETLMLTIAEQIWKYLIEILQTIAEIFEIEMDTIIEKLVEEDQAIIKLINLEGWKNAA